MVKVGWLAGVQVLVSLDTISTITSISKDWMLNG